MLCNKIKILRGARARLFPEWRQQDRYSTTAAEANLKGLEDIPQAKGLPLIGTTLSLILAGSVPKLHKYIDMRHKQLGSIFRENIGPVPCVFISDPEAARLVFAHEGKYPIHLLPESWTTYNALHNVSRGLFFMNGEEWLHFRRMLNPLLLRGDQSWLEDSCRPAIDNLVRRISDFSKSARGYPDMKKLLYRWSLEVIVSVLIGPDNYLRYEAELENEIKQLPSAVQSVFETTSDLSLIPSNFAAKYRIARWRRFEASVTLALKLAAELVDLLSNKYMKGNSGLLGKLRGQMTRNDLAKIVTDLILAAGDTTAYSIEWVLYLMGINPEVQGKLRKELCQEQSQTDGSPLSNGRTLPKPSRATSPTKSVQTAIPLSRTSNPPKRETVELGQKLTSNTLLRNIVKESLRLYPVAPFLTRILPEPVVIKGHNIPAGTILILSIFRMGRDESNFKDPMVFDPDRWVRNEARIGITKSASLPFAIGSRSCIGKKLAEAQLQLTLAEIVRNFDCKVDNNKNVDVVLKMVAVPAEDIKFKFTLLNK